eukprot:COSAG02_NODE_4688_length_5091_cov_8.316185_7_plen_83_part_00
MVIRSFSLANESELLGSHSQRPNQLELPINPDILGVCPKTDRNLGTDSRDSHRIAQRRAARSMYDRMDRCDPRGPTRANLAG